MHAYPKNKEILNENQQKNYCYTFPLSLKVLFGKFHLKSFCSLYTLQLMGFAFCKVFWEHSVLIYGNPINLFLKFVILKMACLRKFVRSKSIHDGLSGFLKHVGSLIKLCRWYVPQNFSIADSVISELKSPTIRKLSYIFICVSNIFPRIFRWFEIRFLWGL